MNQNKLIVILGPTASGKTKLAANLARALNTEIISADSRQVYCDMNIGTGKDYEDYTINGKKIAHHLIDMMPAGSKYNLSKFINDFNLAYNTISVSAVPILCGGTGLYIQSVLHNFDYAHVPKNHQLLKELENLNHQELVNYFNNQPQHSFKAIADLSTQKRTLRAIEIINYLTATNTEYQVGSSRINPLVFGLNPPLLARRKLIEERLTYRLQHGLIEEVEQLLTKGITHEQLNYYGLEYKFISAYLLGQLSIELLQEKLTIAIQQFAKRQMTYFRKMEKDGIVINWIDSHLSFENKLQYCLTQINNYL